MTNLKFDHARTLSSRSVVVSKRQTTISLTLKSEQWTEKECEGVEFDHQCSHWGFRFVSFRFDQLLWMDRTVTIDGAVLAFALGLAFAIARLSLY